MWVWDDDREQMVQREITYVPGLYKIFDEILGMAVIYTPILCSLKLIISKYSL